MALENKSREGNGKRIAFLFIPYLCAIIATVLLIIFLFINITESGTVQLLFDKLPAPSVSDKSDVEISLITPIEEPEEEFPIIYYESQWATLNVDGWERRNIPVLLGESTKVLKKGAGTPMYTQFCGFGGRVVIDAHVTSFFREIEDTPVGTNVHISTIYGQYEYRVDEIKIFDRDDSSVIYPNEDKEELVLYTCYPFNNGYRPRVQRIALICSLVSGKHWERPVIEEAEEW